MPEAPSLPAAAPGAQCGRGCLRARPSRALPRACWPPKLAANRPSRLGKSRSPAIFPQECVEEWILAGYRLHPRAVKALVTLSTATSGFWNNWYFLTFTNPYPALRRLSIRDWSLSY